MNKLKSSLSLGDREKKILMVLVAFALLAAAYFFGYQKFMDKADKYDKETTQLKSKHADLVAKSNNKEQYIEDTKKYKDITSSILADYDNGISQDGSIMFVHTMENANKTWVKSLSMTDPEVVYNFGNIYSTNPSGSGLVYSTDMQGIKSTYTMSYEASYSDWKKLLAYINGYYSKNTIDSISMVYNAGEDIVSGTLVMSAYAITGSNRNYTHPKIKLPTSTVNIFNSAVFNAGEFDIAGNNGNYILSNYDYYITLNSATSDSAAVVMGKKDDNTGTSILSSNNNAPENVSIRFSGSNGRYKVAYKIGNATYPAVDYESGAAFDAGTSLDLLIMSSSRVSDADKSGINLTLINETDMTLNVKICNEDSDSPRLSIASRTGSVEIYK